MAGLGGWADALVHAHDVTAARARAALVVVRTEQGEARAQAIFKRQVAKAELSWKQKLWHLSNRHFACEADAQSALARELKGQPMQVGVAQRVGQF